MLSICWLLSNHVVADHLPTWWLNIWNDLQGLPLALISILGFQQLKQKALGGNINRFYRWCAPKTGRVTWWTESAVIGVGSGSSAEAFWVAPYNIFSIFLSQARQFYASSDRVGSLIILNRNKVLFFFFCLKIYHLSIEINISRNPETNSSVLF